MSRFGRSRFWLWIIESVHIGGLCGAFFGSYLIISVTANYHGCFLGGSDGITLIGSCDQAYFVQDALAFEAGSGFVFAGVVSVLLATAFGIPIFLGEGVTRSRLQKSVPWTGAGAGIGLVAVGGWLFHEALGLSMRIAQTCAYAEACQQVQLGAFRLEMQLVQSLALGGILCTILSVLLGTGQLKVAAANFRVVRAP